MLLPQAWHPRTGSRCREGKVRLAAFVPWSPGNAREVPEVSLRAGAMCQDRFGCGSVLVTAELGEQSLSSALGRREH